MKRTLILALLAPALLCAAGSQQLFNGKDMTGWHFVGPGSFTVEDGLLTTHGGMGLLVYDKQPFGNAVIKVVYKVTGEHDNSGVYIRLPESAPDPLVRRPQWLRGADRRRSGRLALHRRHLLAQQGGGPPAEIEGRVERDGD